MRTLIALLTALALTPTALTQTGDDYAEVETPVGLQTAHAVFDDGVNFAGRYVLATIGCGTECQATYLLNPAPGDAFVSLVSGHGITYRADSRLIIVNPPEELTYWGSDEVPERLHPQCFVYQGGAYGQIGCAGYPG